MYLGVNDDMLCVVPFCLLFYFTCEITKAVSNVVQMRGMGSRKIVFCRVKKTPSSSQTTEGVVFEYLKFINHIHIILTDFKTVKRLVTKVCYVCLLQESQYCLR